MDAIVRLARLGLGEGSGRLWHLLYGGAHTLVLMFALLWLLPLFGLLHRFHRALPSVACWLTASPLAFWALREDTVVLLPWAQVAVAFGVGAATAVEFYLLSRRNQWPLRVVLFLFGIANLLANHFLLYVYYPGSHLVFAALGILSIAIALASGDWHNLLPITAGARRTVVLSALALMSSWVSMFVVIRPRAQVVVALENDESVVFRDLHALLGEEPKFLSFRIVPYEQMAWFTPRDQVRPVRATRPRPIDAKPIVVLITIDAFRRDVFFDPQFASLLPNLHALASRGTVFSNARSTASATSPAIASLFSGKYYSQRRWLPAPIGEARRPFLQQDDAVRVPDLLSKRGVATGAFPSTIGLLQMYGITRGFSFEASMGSNRSRPGHALVKELLAWLPADGRAVFAWVHLLDAHAPYDAGGTQGTAFERYVRELAVVDQQIGVLLTGLANKKLAERAIVIVASDHGEAFGEHGGFTHGKHVYEEVVRIPMWISGPGIVKRTCDAPVSVIDLGPTILDLFGIATPGDFLGQSLLRVAFGEEPAFARPVALDHSQGQQGIVFGDGLKVICHRTRTTCEIYDLNRDPKERNNIVDERADAHDRIGAVNAFFEAHRLKLPGYEPPLR